MLNNLRSVYSEIHQDSNIDSEFEKSIENTPSTSISESSVPIQTSDSDRVTQTPKEESVSDIQKPETKKEIDHEKEKEIEKLKKIMQDETSNKNINSNDSLFYYIERLRIHLEEQLGTDLFVNLYRLLKDIQVQDDDDELNKKIHSLLSQKNIKYLSFINQLIYCEETFT
jgi:hypothetical protein